ncbi:MAG: hypothetical protein WBF57_02375 [Mycobacterium sp.]
MTERLEPAPTREVVAELASETAQLLPAITAAIGRLGHSHLK